MRVKFVFSLVKHENEYGSRQREINVKSDVYGISKATILRPQVPDDYISTSGETSMY